MIVPFQLVSIMTILESIVKPIFSLFELSFNVKLDVKSSPLASFVSNTIEIGLLVFKYVNVESDTASSTPLSNVSISNCIELLI